MRSFNYSAGPSVLPVEVLEQVKAELLDFGGSGMSVMEMSHRGKFYDRIHAECLSLIRELMHVPEDYDILLMQGGGSTQFEAVPLNLMTNHKKPTTSSPAYGRPRPTKKPSATATQPLPQPPRTQISPTFRTSKPFLSGLTSTTAT